MIGIKYSKNIIKKEDEAFIVHEIERSTRFCQICYFVWFIICMLGIIGVQFISVLIIRILWSIILVIPSLVILKRKIIPIINHIKRKPFEGEWITGKVNLKTIRYTGGRNAHEYTIEGDYVFDEQKYMFQDHFYITDDSVDCAFKDVFMNENAPTDITILVDPNSPSKYMVKGALYMQNVHDAFPEYFEKWHHK